MLFYVAAAIAVWIAFNVFFVIWMGAWSGAAQASPAVGAGWVPEHPE